jgi:hypothetical protein
MRQLEALKNINPRGQKKYKMLKQGTQCRATYAAKIRGRIVAVNATNVHRARRGISPLIPNPSTT